MARTQPAGTHQPVYTISDAARACGRLGNRKLIKSLIVHFEIPTYRVGQMVVLDRQGYDRLLRAVEQWDGRPRLHGSGKLRSVKSFVQNI